MGTKLVLRAVAFYSGLSILLLGLQGRSTVMAGWYRKPTAQQDCTINQLCCVVLPDVGPGVDLKVPQGAAVTGVLSYGNLPGISFDATGKNPVTVKHYEPAKDSTSDYFVMKHTGTGIYHNTIDWRGNEIAQYGQVLKVCVFQSSPVGPGGSTTFRLDAYAEVPV